MVRYMIHDRFMDVYFEVSKIHKIKTRGNKRKVRGWWWNWGFDGSSPWLIHPLPVTIKIDNEDWEHWRAFDPDNGPHPGRI